MSTAGDLRCVERWELEGACIAPSNMNMTPINSTILSSRPKAQFTLDFWRVC